MKNNFTVKILSALLASVLILGLTGCQATTSAPSEELVEISSSAADALESADSLSLSVGISLTGSLTYEDETLEFAMETGYDMESVFEQAAAHMIQTSQITYDGESYEETVEIYLVDEDGASYMYAGTGDVWIKSELDESEESSASENIFRTIAEGNTNAVLSDELTTYAEADVYEITLDIDDSQMDDILNLATEAAGSLFADIDTSDMSMSATTYVDADSLEPVYLGIVCDELGEALFAQMFSGIDVNFEIDGFSIEMIYNGFNEIDEIVVPDEVASAAEESEDLDDQEDEEPEETSSGSSEAEALIENAEEIIYSSTTGEIDLEFTFSDGTAEYTFPIPYSELIDNGWTVEGTSDGLVDANDYDLEYMYNGSATMIAYIYNFESSQREYDDCYVVGINMTRSDLGSIQVNLPFDVFLGASTLEDVLEVYGLPTGYYIGETYMYIYYESDDMTQSMTLYFHPSTYVLLEIDVQYWGE